MAPAPHGSDPKPQVQFATTHWSVVLAAGERDTPESRAALVRLCESYWYPLYAYLRRQGHQAADAQDLIQSFFAKLFEADFLQTADPERGRFRSFLLTVLKRFVAKRHRHENALRRGGGVNVLSLNLGHGEQRYQLEPAEDWTAESLYARRWALTVLDNVLARLKDEYAERAQQALFCELKGALVGNDEAAPHADIAVKLQMTPDAVKTAAYRMRCRYRELLRAEVAETVSGEEGVQEELDALLRALRGPTG